MTEVDKGSERTAFVLGLVGPKRLSKGSEFAGLAFLEREEGCNSFTEFWICGNTLRPGSVCGSIGERSLCSLTNHILRIVLRGDKDEDLEYYWHLSIADILAKTFEKPGSFIQFLSVPTTASGLQGFSPLVY
jgi:hypothetical protein